MPLQTALPIDSKLFVIDYIYHKWKRAIMCVFHGNWKDGWVVADAMADFEFSTPLICRKREIQSDPLMNIVDFVMFRYVNFLQWKLLNIGPPFCPNLNAKSRNFEMCVLV